MFNVLPMPRVTEPEADHTPVVDTEEAALNSVTVTQRHVERTRPRWGPWSPLQLLSAILGGFLIVLGTLAIFETGFGSWTETTTSVWGFGHTTLMAAIEIASSAVPGSLT